MLELRKKGNKHWLFIDNEIGEFTPSKFTINRLNNVITIVYFNNLKSKDYNVSDCYIFDIGDISGFNTSDGVAFMDKLEELNCPCFQKDVTNIYGGGSVESVNGQTGDVILGFSDITTAQNLGEFIDGLDSKTDVKDFDEFILSDSEDSLKSKKTRFLDIKNKLKGYFDTFYLSLSVFDNFVEAVFDSLDNKLDKSTTASSVYGTNTAGGQTMIPFSTLQPTLGFTPENVANKSTNLTSPDDTKYPTTLAVVNENKKATITVELISQLTTDFYAPNALRINSTALISGSGTITLKVNDVAYTLGNLITQGQKITVETTTASVYNLISIYE